jgi:hypothetical protein
MKGPAIIAILVSITNSPSLLRQIALKNSNEEQTNKAIQIKGKVVHCLIDNIDQAAHAPDQAQFRSDPFFKADTRKYMQNINGAVDSVTYGCLIYTKSMWCEAAKAAAIMPKRLELIALPNRYVA